MRWFIALALVAAFGVSMVTPAEAVITKTYRFQYDPDNPNNPEGYTQYDGFVRGGRDAQTPAGYNDENWAGGDSFSVFLPGPTLREVLPTHGGSFPYDIMSMIQADGWEDEIGDQPITEAYFNVHLRFSGGCPTPGCPDIARTVEARPMLTKPNIGNGDGLAPPGKGWMTWNHFAADPTDPEEGGVCTTCVGWGDGTGRNGPVVGIDWALEPVVRSSIMPDTANAEMTTENRKKIYATKIFQDWQNGVYPNKGISLMAVDAAAMDCTWSNTLGHCEELVKDPETGELPLWSTLGATSAPANLFFHGADTHASGAAVPDPNQTPRYLPELFITVVPEPAVISLLALGGLVALRRNRR